MKLMLVDDERLLLQSLEMIISNDGSIEVVGTATSADDAIKKNKELYPDIILLDIYLKDKRGVDIIHELKSDNKNVKVILLTSYSNIDNVINSLVMNSDGIVSKDIDSDKLLCIIKGVKRGIRYFDEHEYNILRQYFIDNANTLPKESVLTLSEAELSIIELITQGKNNTQIARELQYSIGTVKNYVSKIMRKMDAQDRTGIAIYALLNNII